MTATPKRTAVRRYLRIASGLFLSAWLFATPAMAQVCTLADERVRAHREFVSAIQSERQLQTYSIERHQAQTIQNCTLMISVGAQAAKQLADWPGPVLHSLITSEQYHELYKEGSFMPRSAVFMDQPLWRYLSLIKTSMPERRHVILLSSSLSNTDQKRLGEAGNEYGINLEGINFQQGMLIDHVLREHARDDTVLLILPDALVLNSGTIRPLIMASYQRDIPLVSYSESLVKAGAMMSVHSGLEELLKESVLRIDAWLSQGRWVEAGFPDDFNVAINYQLARAMRLNLPSQKTLLENMRRVTR